MENQIVEIRRTKDNKGNDESGYWCVVSYPDGKFDEATIRVARALYEDALKQRDRYYLILNSKKN